MPALTLEQQCLFDAHLPLVRTIARKWPETMGAVSRQDLESAGAIGLLDATTRHDGKSNFEAYATIRIRGAVIDEIRRMAPGTRALRPEVLPLSDCLVDHLAAPIAEDSISESYSVAALERAISELSQRQAEVVRLTSRGLTQSAIASRLNLTQACVSQHMTIAKCKLARASRVPVKAIEPQRKSALSKMTTIQKPRRTPAPRYNHREAPAKVQRDPFRLSLPKAVALFERRYVGRAMRMAAGNKAAAARLLGINRTTLVEMLKRQRAKE